MYFLLENSSDKLIFTFVVLLIIFLCIGLLMPDCDKQIKKDIKKRRLKNDNSINHKK